MTYSTLILLIRNLLIGKENRIAFQYSLVPKHCKIFAPDVSLCTVLNVCVLLQLFATPPLSTCTCERSASALIRWLNIYLRCTQSENRFTAAAIIHTNYSMPVDINDVCALFMQKHPRRMEAPSMLFENE